MENGKSDFPKLTEPGIGIPITYVINMLYYLRYTI